MGKHRVIKAFILIIVIFFHSFVLVPKSYATAWQGTAGRLAYRAIAPSVIAALGSGTALVIGAVVAGGIGYLVYKSGAVTALKNWLSGYLNPSVTLNTTQGGVTIFQSDANYDTKIVCDGATYSRYLSNHGMNAWNWQQSGLTQAQAQANINSRSTINPPVVPTDYSTPLATTQPSFADGDIYASPGAAAAIAGGAAISSAVTMSDADANSFIAGLGATPVDSSGIQDIPEGATPTDNTITAGSAAEISLLQSILNYVSNLVGIKTDTAAIKTATDCVASLTSAQTTSINSQSTKLDNIATLTSVQNAKIDNLVSLSGLQRTALDNIAASNNTQTAAINDVKTKVEHLDNTVSNMAATSGTVSTRINSLKTAASTKFPFSLAGSLTVAPVSGSSTYAFASLPLTPTLSIPIAPMLGPLASLFDWIRQLLVWFFWAGTLLAILRRGMEM